METNTKSDFDSQSEIIGAGASKCPWCFSDTHYRASFCTRCRKHRSKLFEYGKMLLTVSTVLGVLGTGITFGLERVVKFFDSIQSPQIEVTAFSTDGDVVLTNPGRREIKALYISTSVANFVTVSRTPVDLEISKSDSVTFSTKTARTQQAIDRNHADQLRIYPDLPIEMAQYSKCNQNAKIMVMSKSNSNYMLATETVKNRGASVTSIPAQCTIYFSPKKAATGVSFECVGVLGIYGSAQTFIKEFLDHVQSGDTC